MTPFIFIVASIATYRATVLLARDAGPYNVFKRLRKSRTLGKMVSCPFCVSIWIAAVIDTAIYLSGYRNPIAVEVCQILAMSAVAIILDRTFTADHLA